MLFINNLYRKMIQSFACKETEKIFLQKFSKKLPQNIQKIAMRKLWMIDASYNINDLRSPPSHYLEKLHGFSPEKWSIRINKQWRICFSWENNSAFQVEIIDYH
jgi:proteic killer suppression protein